MRTTIHLTHRNVIWSTCIYHISQLNGKVTIFGRTYSIPKVSPKNRRTLEWCLKLKSMNFITLLRKLRWSLQNHPQCQPGKKTNFDCLKGYMETGLSLKTSLMMMEKMILTQLAKQPRFNLNCLKDYLETDDCWHLRGPDSDIVWSGYRWEVVDCDCKEVRGHWNLVYLGTLVTGAMKCQTLKDMIWIASFLGFPPCSKKLTVLNIAIICGDIGTQ